MKRKLFLVGAILGVCFLSRTSFAADLWIKISPEECTKSGLVTNQNEYICYEEVNPRLTGGSSLFQDSIVFDHPNKCSYKFEVEGNARGYGVRIYSSCKHTWSELDHKKAVVMIYNYMDQYLNTGLNASNSYRVKYEEGEEVIPALRFNSKYRDTDASLVQISR